MSAVMQPSIVIDPEFRDYLSALRPEEYSTLEKSILETGCETPLILWGDVLVDGHNRYAICTEHGLDFEAEQKAFPDRDAVVDWMLVNQLGRRNLSPDDFRLFVGRLYNSRKKSVGSSNQYSANPQIEGKQNTAETIASDDFRLFVGRLYNARKLSTPNPNGSNQHEVNRQNGGQPSTSERCR